MDGQPPPGGYYGQPNWVNNCQNTNGDPSVELYNNNITLTNSQTETIAELLANPALVQQVAQYDHNSFDQGAYIDGFTHDQNFSIVDSPTVQFHQSTSCPELGIHSTHQIHTSLSMGSFNEVPAMDNWLGDFNFAVEFNKAQDKTKATPWIFSTRLQKLFVSMDKACPIIFRIQAHPTIFSTFRIRGQIVYSRAEDCKDVVERCINHQGKDQPQSTTAPHVLRCEDKEATYVIAEDRRHSVIVPLKCPPAGSTSITHLFRFMCLSSCIGSLNRRPTKLIFTLETMNGEPVGRYACDVRICSCPGRDIKAEEEKLSTEETADLGNNLNLIPIYLPPAGVSKGKTKKRKASPPANPPANNTTVEDTDVYTFTVQIRGRHQYMLIRDLVNRLLADPLVGNNNSGNEAVEADTVKRFKEEP